jgi:putative ABC transport system permease protein
VNSFVRLSRVDPGVDSAGLMTMRVSLRSAYPDREAWSPLFQELLEGVRSIPGVTSASLTTSLPFAGIGVMSQVVALDSPVAEGAEFIASTYISGGHFQNMGMSLLQGGDFERGSEEGPLQVIVNEAFARRYWPETNSVVGRRVRMGEAADDPVATVVGMVGSLRYRHDQSEAEELYFDMDTQPWQSMWVIARTGRGPSSVAPSLRQALWRIDPDLPIDRIASLDELAWNSIGQPRFYSGLAASLAAIALILALVGLYGTMAYSVSARVRELGIRMALGASPAGVVALVLRGGARLVALGVVAGTGVAWVVSRLLERFLFGVVATDLATFVVVAALFIGTASIACWLPARRAASLDPVNALRCDD